MSQEVFISRSFKDKAVAERICAKLEEHQLLCWIAPRNIPTGMDWAEAIMGGIDHCRAMILVFSANANGCPNVRRQLQRAFEKGIPIVPFRIENVQPNASLEYYLGSMNWRDPVIEPLDLNIEHLVTQVKGVVGVNAEPEQATPVHAKVIADKPGQADELELLRVAAEQGSAAAQFNLGVLYENGDGVERDLAEALRWYRKAAEQNDADAQFNLGVCYFNGKGVERDEKEAVAWYRKAAEQGFAPAQFNLGVCYYSGNGVPKDETEAVGWYRKAAENGFSSAQFNLGVCCESGIGTAKDEKEAVVWYRKAAEQGDADAQYNLGVCYEYGKGVERDEMEAAMCFKKAAEQGDADVQDFLDELNS